MAGVGYHLLVPTGGKTEGHNVYTLMLEAAECLEHSPEAIYMTLNTTDVILTYSRYIIFNSY